MNTERSSGFTLLELIMTIVLFGIVAVMAVSFFAPSTTMTHVPVQQLQSDAFLQLVMENMIADKETSFANNLNGLCANINVGVQSTYGNGTSYYVVERRYVCPNASNVFVNSAINQFLLVTIAANANSGAKLTYLFSSNAGNCNAGGS
ncbi:MAG TPA: type II secretion system protein [Solidesulfovibrio magneticus]|nr:type II secretion system protein [Solidesulfovibrio magneticus]